MGKDLFHCLHYYSFPRELWKKIRTTNMLERDFREVRRRTRPMGFFPHEESAQRIFYRVTNGTYQNGHHLAPSKSAEILTLPCLPCYSVYRRLPEGSSLLILWM